MSGKGNKVSFRMSSFTLGDEDKELEPEEALEEVKSKCHGNNWKITVDNELISIDELTEEQLKEAELIEAFEIPTAGRDREDQTSKKDYEVVEVNLSDEPLEAEKVEEEEEEDPLEFDAEESGLGTPSVDLSEEDNLHLVQEVTTMITDKVDNDIEININPPKATIAVKKDSMLEVFLSRGEIVQYLKDWLEVNIRRQIVASGKVSEE